MSNRPKVELKGEKAREFIKKVVALSESNNAAAQHYGYEAGVLEGILRNKGKITAQDVESVICDAISQIYSTRELSGGDAKKLSREVTAELNGLFQAAVAPSTPKVTPKPASGSPAKS